MVGVLFYNFSDLVSGRILHQVASWSICTSKNTRNKWNKEKTKTKTNKLLL